MLRCARYLTAADPAHARSGRHLTRHEALEFTRPTAKAVGAVRGWLNDQGIDDSLLQYGPGMSWIGASLPVKKIEALLQTKYSVFVHNDGTRLERTTEYSLPIHLHEYISTVQPTTCFLRGNGNLNNRHMVPSFVRKNTIEDEADVVKRSGPACEPGNPLCGPVNSICDPMNVIPQCLRNFYGTANYTARATAKNKMALTNFLGAFANHSDDTLFLKKFRPDAVAGASNFKVVSVANGTLAQVPTDSSFVEQILGFEGALDSQTLLAIGSPTPLTIYSTGGTNPDFIPEAPGQTDFDEPYVAWLQYLLALPDEELPTVISVSYNDDEQTVSTEYATQACRLFAQIGARSVAVFACSGDFGVGLSGTCVSNDGRNASTFLPQFPASCPYVTAVGGTKNFNPEGKFFFPSPPTLFQRPQLSRVRVFDR